MILKYVVTWIKNIGKIIYIYIYIINSKLHTLFEKYEILKWNIIYFFPYIKYSPIHSHTGNSVTTYIGDVIVWQVDRAQGGRDLQAVNIAKEVMSQGHVVQSWWSESILIQTCNLVVLQEEEDVRRLMDLLMGELRSRCYIFNSMRYQFFENLFYLNQSINKYVKITR